MYNDILSALETKLQTFANSEGYDVSWPDVKFTPTGSYLEPFILPAETATGGLTSGSYQDYAGIYQINVVTKKGAGTSDVRAMVENVLTEFNKAEAAGIVLIEKSWPSGSFDRDEAYFVVPISVRYRLLS